MKLQEYIDALQKLPEEWRNADREWVPVTTYMGLLFAAHINQLSVFHNGEWKSPEVLSSDDYPVKFGLPDGNYRIVGDGLVKRDENQEC